MRKHIARGYTDRNKYESFRSGEGDLDIHSKGQGDEMLLVPKPNTPDELGTIRDEVNQTFSEWEKSESGSTRR